MQERHKNEILKRVLLAMLVQEIGGIKLKKILKIGSMQKALNRRSIVYISRIAFCGIQKMLIIDCFSVDIVQRYLECSVQYKGNL